MALPHLKFSPEAAGYSAETSGTVRMYNVSGGPRFRSVAVTPTDQFRCSWEFDREEFDLFMRFYRFKLKNGANKFTCNLILSGLGFAEYTLNFVPDTIKVTGAAGFSRTVTAQLVGTLTTDPYEIDVSLDAMDLDVYTASRLLEEINILVNEDFRNSKVF